MEDEKQSRFAQEAEELAGTAARLLREELSGGDVKRAKDLSGIFKDMAALARELGGGGTDCLTVRFENGTEEASG
jgi:hypothetical protein